MTNNRENPFIGTWKLVSQHTHYPDGDVTPSRGENAIGILMYDTAGNMAVQLARTDEHAKLYNDMSDLATAMDGYLGYFGTYEIDVATTTIIHRVRSSSYFDYRSSVQHRQYVFSDEGRTLTLSALASGGAKRVLIWERVTD